MLARDDIERLVPALRRCAHALSAGPDATSTGDELVRETLKRAMQSRSPSSGVRLEVWLIALLVDLSRAAADRPGPGVTMPSAAELRTDRPGERAVATLAAMQPDLREVLVAVSVARLSYAEAAAALGLPASRLVERLTAARDQFASLEAARATGMRRARHATHLRVIK